MKAMVPSDAIDLNRPMATGRLVPAALVQEKAGLPKAACIPRNIMASRAHVNSRMNHPSRDPLFPIDVEERVATNRHNEHLLFLLGETLELKVPRLGLLSSLKRMIIRPSITPNIPPPSCVTLSYTPQFVSSIPVPLGESPLFKAPAPMVIIAPPREDAPQPNASEFSGNILHQELHLQLRMAMETTCTANRAAVGSVRPTEASPQPFFAHPAPPNHTLNSTSLVTPALKNSFVEVVSEVTTEADSSSFPLTPLLSPFERAIAEARAAGYHLHKPVSLVPPPSTPTPPRSCSAETQRVLHGDGLRRLVLFKNTSACHTHDTNDKVTEKSSSPSNSLSIALQSIDFELCLKRVGRGVGDDWINRVRLIPSTVNLDVRLWDSKRTEDDKIEVQLGKALLKSSPLKRVLKNTTRKPSVDLDESRSIRRCLRSVRSNLHRQRVVVDIGANRASQSTSSLVSIPRERRREQVRNRVRAKRRDVSKGTSEALDKVRRWSDAWKRRARLMATPKPNIEAARSNRAQEASALSAILTTDRRPGWFNPREHVKREHIYFEEDTSDEEPAEHDDEPDIDDVCHTSCKPVFVSLPSPVDTSPSSKLSNGARLLVQVKEETQAKGPEHGKHGRIPLFGVYSLKAFERQSKRTGNRHTSLETHARL